MIKSSRKYNESTTNSALNLTYKGSHYNAEYRWNNIGTKQNLCDLYEPKLYLFEEPKQFDIKLNSRRKIVLNNIISMFYSINQCNNLKTQYEQQHFFTYDYVIRIRPDLFFNSIPTIMFEKNKIYTSKTKSSERTNDTFAVGDSITINIYSEIFFNLKFIQDTYKCSSAPEHLLQYWLKYNKIQNYKCLPYYPLYRMITKNSIK